MPPRRLLERTALGAARPLLVQGETVHSRHQQLTRLMRNVFGDEVADMFAEPAFGPDGAVDWYTRQEGTIERLSEMEGEERAAVIAAWSRTTVLLSDYAMSQKSKVESHQQTIGILVESALLQPSEEHIFAVGGRPMITAWGHAPAAVRAEPEALSRSASQQRGDIGGPIPPTKHAAQPPAAPHVPSSALEEPELVALSRSASEQRGDNGGPIGPTKIAVQLPVAPPLPPDAVEEPKVAAQSGLWLFPGLRWLVLALLIGGLAWAAWGYFKSGRSFSVNEIDERIIDRGGVSASEVSFSLVWQSLNDLDLIVVEPGGEPIFYNKKESVSGGRLDLDSNSQDKFSRQPVENIVWRTGAPKGLYKVYVLHFLEREVGDSDFLVRVRLGGVEKRISGRIGHGNDPRMEIEKVSDPNLSPGKEGRGILFIGAFENP